jgi:hypothetical protein
MYNEWLFDADIVLADLTFGNPNVYYELGIRQALSKKGTVLVACKGAKLLFDVRNQYVIKLRLLCRTYPQSVSGRVASSNRECFQSRDGQSRPRFFTRASRRTVQRPKTARSKGARTHIAHTRTRSCSEGSAMRRSGYSTRSELRPTGPRVLSLYHLISVRDIKSVLVNLQG